MKRKILLCFVICLLTTVFAFGCQQKSDDTPEKYSVGFVQAVESPDGYATVYVPSNRDAKVLLLADPQLDPTEKYSIVGSYNRLTIEFLDKFLDAADPDFAIVAGDITMTVLFNNWDSFCEIADIFEEKEIPWTFTFGNHDCEKEYVRESAGSESALWQMPKQKLIDAVQEKYDYCLIYSGECADGYGNHVVNVRNTKGKLLNAFCNLDCVYDDEGYSHVITQAQTDFYTAAIEKLNAQEGTTVPSVVVTHVALPQMFIGYREAKNNTGDGVYYYGDLIEGDYSSYADKSPFFDEMLRLGSTKAVFFGHHHGNDASIGYKGIRLSFIPHSGMSHEYRTDHSEEYGIDGWPAGTVFDLTAVDVYGDHRGGVMMSLKQDATYTFGPLLAAEVIPDYKEWAIDYDEVAEQIAQERGAQYVIRGK